MSYLPTISTKYLTKCYINSSTTHYLINSSLDTDINKINEKINNLNNQVSENINNNSSSITTLKEEVSLI